MAFSTDAFNCWFLCCFFCFFSTTHFLHVINLDLAQWIWVDGYLVL